MVNLPSGWMVVVAESSPRVTGGVSETGRVEKTTSGLCFRRDERLDFT